MISCRPGYTARDVRGVMFRFYYRPFGLSTVILSEFFYDRPVACLPVLRKDRPGALHRPRLPFLLDLLRFAFDRPGSPDLERRNLPRRPLPSLLTSHQRPLPTFTDSLRSRRNRVPVIRGRRRRLASASVHRLPVQIYNLVLGVAE